MVSLKKNYDVPKNQHLIIWSMSNLWIFCKCRAEEHLPNTLRQALIYKVSSTCLMIVFHSIFMGTYSVIFVSDILNQLQVWSICAKSLHFIQSGLLYILPKEFIIDRARCMIHVLKAMLRGGRILLRRITCKINHSAIHSCMIFPGTRVQHALLCSCLSDSSSWS